MTLTESAVLEPGAYLLPDGIKVAKEGITIVGDGVNIIGSNREGTGLKMQGVKGVEIHGLSLRDFYHGIHMKDCKNCKLENLHITSTSEIPANTIFLDIWMNAENPYGGAVCLVNCDACEIIANDFQHQMNGILTYACKKLSVKNNLCNYNSGYGIHLYETCDSEFIENSCDYCCRFEPREGGLHYGHMGADAAGVLAVYNSSRNKFIRNTARLGGDGFFLAGLHPNGTPCGCNENIFEENDASLSPNIAFESTFCEKNVFKNNFADRCNFGFWCGYSKDFIIENNRILYNRQAGIAVENGVGFKVQRNTFQSCGNGVLMWSRQEKTFQNSYPDRDTCKLWEITENRFFNNGTGIRIASDQNHGIRDLPEELWGGKHLHPHHNKITKNDIQNNRIGIELIRTHKNEIKENILNKNVEANIRLSDAEDNLIVNNIGSAGAYL